MDIIANLQTGFGAAFSFNNLLFAFAGCLLGTLVGVLPGIGTIATIAMLLPLTYGMEPLTALIMLAGIYYGAQYGGSTTAILVNLPGEATSVVTTLDGYKMALAGRAGAALGIAALSSFLAGTIGTLFVALFAPALVVIAYSFNSPEYFSLMVLGLVASVVLVHGSPLKGVAMIFLGILLGLVGLDANTGTTRFTFGVRELWDGVGFLPLVMGMFGIAEIIRNLEQPEARRKVAGRIGSVLPSANELRQATPAAVRGSLLGSILGILPGGGVMISSFASYMLERNIARDPTRFGHGAVEGVAGPEAANNAAAQTSFVPLMTLGIPSNAVMALIMGALMIQGVSPGSALINNRPDLFWGMVASMWIGNAMLLVINLPLAGLWIRLLSVPYRILFPCILAFCCIGIVSVEAGSLPLLMTAVLAMLGYILSRFGCEIAPLVLGFVMGPMLEQNLRRSMAVAHGDPLIFVTRPVSLALLALAMAMLAWALVRFGRSTKTATEGSIAAKGA